MTYRWAKATCICIHTHTYVCIYMYVYVHVRHVPLPFPVGMNIYICMYIYLHDDSTKFSRRGSWDLFFQSPLSCLAAAPDFLPVLSCQSDLTDLATDDISTTKTTRNWASTGGAWNRCLNNCQRCGSRFPIQARYHVLPIHLKLILIMI